MTSPSVVILTDPANCELADGRLLLEALLEVQQLSREGVPTSQAFCDNPAAAAEFIDAYAKAYPGLQLESADLPVPEQLYSMLVDGRLAPLPDLNPTTDGTRPEIGATLNPLVVLSLGKPDGLMQALQGSRSVSNSINVIEIAPDPEARNVPISVAAAVASHAIAGTSWSAETASVGSRHGEEDHALPAAEEAANAPLRLESAEFNLDYIQRDTNGEQARDSLPATIVVDITPVGAAGDGGAGSSARADPVAAGSVIGTSSASEPVSPGPTAAPAPQPAAAPAPEPIVAPAPEPAEVSESTSPSPDGRADALDNAPPDERPADVAPSLDKPDDNVVEPDTSVAETKAIEPDDEDLGDERSSFSEPDEDVIYAPTGTFTPEDDMSYPLPAAAAPEADGFGGVLRMSMADDIVDLEAIFSSGAADAPEATEPFEPIMMRPPGPDGHGGHDGYGPQPLDVDLGHLDLPGSDQDSHQDKTITPVHDLDI